MLMIGWFEGDRTPLAELFALADDAPAQVERYRDLGRVLVARDGSVVVGHLQLVVDDDLGQAEVKSLAVRADHQGTGVGRALIERAIAVCRAENRSALLVATAAADTGVLHFYQRLGFRFLCVERDVFTEEAGYPPVEIDGVPLRDQVWLSLNLHPRDGALAKTQLRVARHTERLGELVLFYRDGLGLKPIGGFRDHNGYDGAFLEVPGTGTHLEFTAGGGHPAPAPHPESLLVLYLGDDQAVREVVDRLGVDPVIPANPYWAEHASTVADPDGFHVVLVPERWQP